MKRFVALILVFIMLFSLCGCNLRQAVSRSGTEYIVSAIGFDQTGDTVSVTLETVITKTEDSESQNETKLLRGVGDSIYTAFSDALKYATEPLTLSHLGVAVMGTSLDMKNFQTICDWFYTKQDTTLSTFFVSAENSEELLSKKAVSSIAVGYDLVGLLEQENNESGADYQNRFYKTEALRLQKSPTFTLPFFTYKGDEFYLDGVTVYKSCQPQTVLKRNETIFYLIACNKQKSGTVILDNQPLKLIYSQTKYLLKDASTPTVILDITLKSERGTIPKEKIIQGITELFQKMKERNIDIFNISEIIKEKNNKLWQKLDSQLEDGFYNLDIEVKVNDR